MQTFCRNVASEQSRITTHAGPLWEIASVNKWSTYNSERMGMGSILAEWIPVGRLLDRPLQSDVSPAAWHLAVMLIVWHLILQHASIFVGCRRLDDNFSMMFVQAFTVTITERWDSMALSRGGMEAGKQITGGLGDKRVPTMRTHQQSEISVRKLSLGSEKGLLSLSVNGGHYHRWRPEKRSFSLRNIDNVGRIHLDK